MMTKKFVSIAILVLSVFYASISLSSHGGHFANENPFPIVEQLAQDGHPVLREVSQKLTESPELPGLSKMLGMEFTKKQSIKVLEVTVQDSDTLNISFIVGGMHKESIKVSFSEGVKNRFNVDNDAEYFYTLIWTVLRFREAWQSSELTRSLENGTVAVQNLSQVSIYACDFDTVSFVEGFYTIEDAMKGIDDLHPLVRWIDQESSQVNEGKGITSMCIL